GLAKGRLRVGAVDRGFVCLQTDPEGGAILTRPGPDRLLRVGGSHGGEEARQTLLEPGKEVGGKAVMSCGIGRGESAAVCPFSDHCFDPSQGATDMDDDMTDCPARALWSGGEWFTLCGEEDRSAIRFNARNVVFRVHGPFRSPGRQPLPAKGG